MRKQEREQPAEQTVATVRFQTLADRRRVQKAASLSGKSFSSLVVEAAVKRADQIIVASGGPCPTCGHRHGKKRAA